MYPIHMNKIHVIILVLALFIYAVYIKYIIRASQALGLLVSYSYTFEMARVTASLAELEARQKQLDISHKNDIRDLRQQIADLKAVVGVLSDTIVSVDWKKLAAQVEPTIVQLAEIRPVVNKMAKVLEGLVLTNVASANAFRTELAARKVEAQEQLGEDLEEGEEEEEEENEDVNIEEEEQAKPVDEEKEALAQGARRETYQQSPADAILFSSRHGSSAKSIKPNKATNRFKSGKATNSSTVQTKSAQTAKSTKHVKSVKSSKSTKTR
jgi:hypothetical protein